MDGLWASAGDVAGRGCGGARAARAGMKTSDAGETFSDVILRLAARGSYAAIIR